MTPGNNPITDQLTNILQAENGSERMQKLRALRDRNPPEALAALVALLNSPDQELRRRAGSSLAWFREFVATQAPVLADRLQRHPDDHVRVSCAIHLMPVRQPAVDQATSIASTRS